MTIAEIAQEIKEFAEARNWTNSDPCELITALTIELGELGEHFLWQKEFEQNLSEEKKRELGYEMVDVLIYLLQISNKCGIPDLGAMYADKIKRLAEKYPVELTNDEDWHKKHLEYKKTGKNKLYK